MPDKLTLILFFSALPTIDAALVAAAISDTEPRVAASDVSIDVTTDGPDGVLADIAFPSGFPSVIDGHAIRLIGIPAPMPRASYDAELQNAHLRADHKQAIAMHTSHMIVYYEGRSDSGVEQTIALYKVAFALRNDGMRGVFCPATSMMQAPELLANIVAESVFADFRRSPAAMMAFWLGYVKFHKPNGGWWLATRGGALYGVPDFAFLVTDLREADAVVSLFGDIVSYAFQSGRPLGAGHTMQVGEAQLRLRAVYEYPDFLGADTLVIERTTSPKKRGWVFGRG